jgi:hypothetical protein
MNAYPARRRKGVYKFVITEDVQYETPIKNKEFENEWLKVEKTGKITVKGSHGNGYAWDGCSPKINILDIFLFGTPDGLMNVNTGKPVTYYASLIHDILYQFRKDIPISRKTADDIFLIYLGDFRLKSLYYAAVRFFGEIYSSLNK